MSGPVSNLRVRFLAAGGPLAALIFFGSVAGFAAWREDDYSHSARWVSELGTGEGIAALTFNLLGFNLPGLLIILVATGLAVALPARLGCAMLAFSGLSFMLVGMFPLTDSSGEIVNRVHTVVAHNAGLAFGVGLVLLSPVLRGHPEFAPLGRATGWFVAFLIIYPVTQLAFERTGLPIHGLGQRVALAGYFLWFGLAGWRLWRLCEPCRGSEFPGLQPGGRRRERPDPAIAAQNCYRVSSA